MDAHRDPALLSAYLDEELAPGDRARLLAHIGGCAACRKELETLAAAKALTGRARRRAAPAALLAAVAALEPRAARPSLRRWVPAAAVAAAALAAAAVAFLPTRRVRAPEGPPVEALMARHARAASAGVAAQAGPKLAEFSLCLAQAESREDDEAPLD